MPRINYIKLEKEFIYEGLFSEYLPSEFTLPTTINLLSIPISEKNDFAEPLSFNMSRFSEDGKRRIIYIPELSSYVKTVKFMKEKNLIRDLINTSLNDHSFSPLIQESGELTRHECIYNLSLAISESEQENVRSTYIPNIVKKINLAKGAKGILFLDIANFYPSIYTHLLPCIKLGFESAENSYKLIKANNNAPVSTDYSTYAQLDILVRNMNVGRTNGLLPGTLSSQFLAEALLSKIDEELEQQNIKFVRYVDDFEIFVYNESDISRLQNTISKTLNKYFLSINHEKTKYKKFPYYVVDNLQSIYQQFDSATLDDTETMQLFNSYFTIEENGTKGAIRFLIKSLKILEFRSPELYSSYLFNVLVNDSRSLVKVCELLISNKDSLEYNSKDIELVDDLLKQHIHVNNHLETIWLLYLRKKLFNKRLPAIITNLIISSDNDLGKIILLEEYKSSLSRKMIERIKDNAKSWLLCYQLFCRDYIDKNTFSLKSGIKHNKSFYNHLKRNGYSLYHKS